MTDYEPMISHSETLLRLFLAVLLGGLIGLEREKTSWFAGLRTHMLVCVGSALIMIVSQFGFENILRKDLVVLDPSRIAAQVISGIGFLGAGTILFWKNMIRGLTTAASLWAVAAIGLAVGSGLYLAAASTTILILLILAGVKPLEKIFFKKKHTTGIKLRVKTGISLMVIEDVFKELNLNLTNLQIDLEDEIQVIYLFFTTIPKKTLLELVDKIKQLAGVERIEMID